MSVIDVLTGASALLVGLTAFCGVVAGFFAAVVLMLKNFRAMQFELATFKHEFGKLKHEFGSFGSALGHADAEAQRTNMVIAALTKNLVSGDVAEAVKSLRKPEPAAVIRWAEEHRAANPWDMGPLNWERCLYDLGYGGYRHELIYDSDGKLTYR